MIKRLLQICALSALSALVGLSPAAPALAQQDDVPERPYDAQLMRLAEILGALHYLRPLCGAEEEQVWRDKMRELLDAEKPEDVRRAALVDSFNRGYRGFQRTYRSCNDAAGFLIDTYLREGREIAQDVANRYGS